MNHPKTFLIALIIIPAISFSQKTLPRFENDTVYTSCGYKIYVGSILNFANGTRSAGRFKFVKIYSADHSHLSGAKVLVKKIKSMNVSGLGNYYAHIIGSIIHNDGTTDRIDFAINFDDAIEGVAGIPAELNVPDEYKGKTKTKADLSEEMKKIKDLLYNKSITQEEYDSLKKTIQRN